MIESIVNRLLFYRQTFCPMQRLSLQDENQSEIELC